MVEIAQLKVQLIGWTQFVPPKDVDWTTDADGPDAIAEFAGRACYQSWSKPNPETATNRGYLGNILDVGHFSVLEHGTASFYVTGVSRSLTHELVRHRHLSYSQLSQRYVNEGDARIVIPPDLAGDLYAPHQLRQQADLALNAYRATAERLASALEYVGDRTRRRKLARQAARAVLPNMIETRIVVSGNLRAWRGFIELRATEAADPEIRALTVEVYRRLLLVAPNELQDMREEQAEDGSTVIVKIKGSENGS